MIRELPITPASITIMRSQPKHTHVSKITGKRRVVHTLSPFWKGELAFPPIQDVGIKTAWRAFCASISREGGNFSFYIPARNDWRHTAVRNSVRFASSATPTGDITLPTVLPIQIGDVVEFISVRSNNLTGTASFTRVIVDVTETATSMDIRLDQEIPASPIEWEMEYGAPNIRAIPLNDDAFSTTIQEAAIENLAEIEWVEASHLSTSDIENDR